MHAHSCHVGANVHGRLRQPLAEIEVGAVGLVGEHLHAVGVGDLNDGLQIGADAVVGGIVHEHSLGVRMGFDGGAHILHLHPQRNAQTLIHLRIDVDRLRIHQHQRIDDTAVHVARQNDLVARRHHRKNHRLHRRRGAANHQKSRLGFKSVGGKHFSLADHTDRMAEVVQTFHRIDIDGNAGLAQKSRELLVALAALVTRHIKRHDALTLEIFQRVQNRHTVLIHLKILLSANRLSRFPGRHPWRLPAS